MYGTVGHMKAKPGKLDEIMKLNADVVRTRKPKGYIGEYIYQLDSNPDEFILAVLFENKESYHANANDPAQDADYQKLRALLDADPHWHDGEVIHSHIE